MQSNHTAIEVTEITNALEFIHKEILHNKSFFNKNENPPPISDNVNPTIATGTANSVNSFALVAIDTDISPVTATANVVIAQIRVVMGIIFFMMIIV